MKKYKVQLIQRTLLKLYPLKKGARNNEKSKNQRRL